MKPLYHFCLHGHYNCAKFSTFYNRSGIPEDIYFKVLTIFNSVTMIHVQISHLLSKATNIVLQQDKEAVQL